MTGPTLRRVTPSGLLVMPARTIQADREAWLAARRYNDRVGYCIGSSDVPAILGIEGAGNPVKVWYEKVRGLNQPETPEMMWGRLHEDTIARYWRDLNRAAVQNVGLIASASEPWNQTTLDRKVIVCPLVKRKAGRSPGEEPTETATERCALEIKTRGAFGSMRYHNELPDDVFGQILHQLFCTGYDHIHYAILKGGNTYRQGVVRAEEEAETMAYVMRRVREYRAAHLAGLGQEVEPVWPIEDKAAQLIDLDGMLHPDRDGIREIEEVGPVLTFAEVRARYNALKKDYDRAKAELLRLAAGARYVTTGTDDGSQLAYEFSPRNRTKVDLDALRENYPKAYADPAIVQQTTSWQLDLAKPYQVNRKTEETG
jgi:putative phage-type endonuclease